MIIEDGPAAVAAEARSILRAYMCDGAAIPPGDVSELFAALKQVTVYGVLVAAVQVRLEQRRMERLEFEPRDAEGLTRRDMAAVADALTGQRRAVLAVAETGFLNRENLVRFLAAVLRSEQASEARIDELFTLAEEFCRDVLAQSNGFPPPRGAGAGGPWDFLAWVGSLSGLLDLGSLLVPSQAAEAFEPLYVDDLVVGVTLTLGDSCMDLQAFAAPNSPLWEETRLGIAEGLRSQGATVTTTSGRFGKELRASLPSGQPSGDVYEIRVIGRDGPGWLLRAFIYGDEAVTDTRAYDAFADVIVVPSPALPGQSTLNLRWPGTVR
ncbi:DUF3710 domain-containing protein [Streptomyces sp. NPDC001941]|uniref:DUF3710 domain-containing protein n=1 Tax=Streptomyces sp. NPDC001941 TaxID=3154659 RepID=UPI00331D59C1